MNPCGQALDFLRYGYQVKCKLFRDSDQTVTLKWYTLPWDAPLFKDWHLFASGVYSRGSSPWVGPGEVEGARRVYDPKGPSRHYEGRCFLGPLDWWQQGPPVAILDLPAAELPLCCATPRGDARLGLLPAAVVPVLLGLRLGSGAGSSAVLGLDPGSSLVGFVSLGLSTELPPTLSRLCVCVTGSALAMTGLPCLCVSPPAVPCLCVGLPSPPCLCVDRPAMVTFSGVRLIQPGNIPVPASVPTSLTWGTGAEVYDTDSYHNPGLYPSRITVPEDGFYHVTGLANFGGGGVGPVSLYVYLNGSASTQVYDHGYIRSTGDDLVLGLSCTLELVAGDYLELVMFQSTPAAGSSNVGEFEVFRVPGKTA